MLTSADRRGRAGEILTIHNHNYLMNNHASKIRYHDNYLTEKLEKNETKKLTFFLPILLQFVKCQICQNHSF